MGEGAEAGITQSASPKLFQNPHRPLPCVHLNNIAIIKNFGRDLRTDNTRNSQLARNDRRVAGNAAFVGNDRCGLLHNGHEFRMRHGGHQDFPRFELFELAPVRDYPHPSARLARVRDRAPDVAVERPAGNQPRQPIRLPAAVNLQPTVAQAKGTTELERVIDVVGDPALQGREVCATAYQGRLACFDAVNGTQLWVREISSVTGVSLDARYAFVSDEKGAVQAFDRSNGRAVWKQDKLALRQLTLPLPAGNAVAVGDFEGFVHFLARDSGAFLARYSARGGGVRAAPIALPSGVLVQTQSGRLHALSL